jgi:hypothetical protein
MEEVDALVAVAEISVGIAGFSGVVAALQWRDRWHAWDRIRTASLLFISFGAVVLSLFPIALNSFGVADPALWRWSSASMLAYLLIYGAAMLRAIHRVGRNTLPYQRWADLGFWSVGLSSAAFHAINLASGKFSLFFAGLLVLLVFAAAQFAGILFQRPLR